MNIKVRASRLVAFLLKNIVLPMGLGLSITLIIQYVFMRHSNSATTTENAVAGKSFLAPEKKQELKPLNREINFIDNETPQEEITTQIETPFAQYIFSTEGGSLQKLMFKRVEDGHVDFITTLAPSETSAKNEKCFLLALSEKTPYYYTLIDKKESDLTVSLTYKATTDNLIITKHFIVYKKIYRLDVHIDIQSHHNRAITARLFFPAPHMTELGMYDVITAIMSDDKGAIKIIGINALDMQQGWYAPAVFGIDNKYFAHILVKDEQHFVERAYYKLGSKNMLYAILESSEISRPLSSWNLEFYFGPKEEQAMNAVDHRLTDTLAYAGWLASISSILLRILNFLYTYLGNYGWAIILLTTLIKLVMVPFTWGADEQRKKSAEYKKKLTYIQQKYKNDPERLMQERALLVKQHGMPGLSGCLPLLLQLPVFVALSRVLGNSIELYKAPFLWIKDLSAHDPYYLLPLFVSLSMLMQAIVLPGKESKLPMVIMALVFGALAANFSAGLALYILINTLFSVLQMIMQVKVRGA